MLAQTVVGTPLFMAPEVLMPMMAEGVSDDDDDEGSGGASTDQENGYGKNGDVWSVGILVAEMLNNGKMPWPTFASAGRAFMHINSAEAGAAGARVAHGVRLRPPLLHARPEAPPDGRGARDGPVAALRPPRVARGTRSPIDELRPHSG